MKTRLIPTLAMMLATLTAPALASEQLVAPAVDAQIRDRLNGYLKDGASAQVEYLSAPRHASYVFAGMPSEGEVVCARVNAKNSYAAYTGWRPFMFSLKANGSVGVIQSGERHSDQVIDQICGAYLRR